MDGMLIRPGEMAQWDAALSEAQFYAEMELSVDIRAYLLHLLIRFTREVCFAKSIIAIEILEALHQLGVQSRANALRDAGDKCLLLAGFFPERAHSCQVGKRYFMDMGQSAYHRLTDLTASDFSDIAMDLRDHFPSLVTLLHTMKQGPLNALSFQVQAR